MAGLRRRGGP